MFKKMLVCVVVLGVVFMVGVASAEKSNQNLYNPDCDGKRALSTSMCPSGYRAQGVAYNDMAGSDEADAISPICRHVTKGNDMMPTDFQSQPATFLCEKQEVMSGIACKDMPKSGAQADDLDGCTAICYNPRTHQERTLYNADLEGNHSRSYQVQKIDLPNRIFGIAYQDRSRGTSDVADCATVVYRYEPIVK